MSNVCFYLDDVKEHSRRVGELCSKLVVELRISASVSEAIVLAGTLHDIGKNYIPTHLLNAPRPLSKSEKYAVDMHAVYGFKILEEKGYPEMICQFVRMHHGVNKCGCLESCVISKDVLKYYTVIMAADIYDALTNDREYRKALSKEEAFQIIESCGEIPKHVVNALRKVVG